MKSTRQPTMSTSMTRYARRRQRGVTMVSVMLMTVSLLTVGLLAVRSSVREVDQAGQLVSRERALLVAEAAADLAAAQYLEMDEDQINAALTGFNPQGGTCSDPCGDCVPGAGTTVTGQRNEVLAGAAIACGGRPCMRQGSVSQLADATAVPSDWCDLPFRDLITNGDPDARVSVWVRNNAADALGASGSGIWTEDGDGRIVVTAQAQIRNTTVTIEKELAYANGGGAQVMQPLSPDEGYGGGHNNDNSAVSVCTDDYVSADAV